MAYADFVTAMMALFIVLWLMASSEQVKRSIAAYFLDPKGHKQEVGSGGLTGSGKSMFVSISEMKALKAKLEQAFHSLPAVEKLRNQITMTITGEGLRIELVEDSHGVFFESGNARPTALGVQAIGLLATQLNQLPNAIVLEGHTDAVPYTGVEGYTNWELSTDRAHQARRLMQANGVRSDQIKQIRGYADQSPRNLQNPSDPSNRRISVIVLYGDPSSAPPGNSANAVGKVSGSTAKVPAESANLAIGNVTPPMQAPSGAKSGKK